MLYRPNMLNTWTVKYIIIFIFQSTMGSTLYSAGQSKRTLNLREQIQTRKHFLGSSRGVSVPLKKFWFLC